MTDLISRQAAIDAADMADYPGLSIEDVDKVTGEVVKALKELPSAQPMMTNAADLINRGDAILAVNKRIKQVGMENNADVLSIRQSIRDLSSAQPYTEEQIQTMQDLESAEIEKAYELGRESAQQERKRGRWTRPFPTRPKTYERFCSECKGKAWYCGTGDYNYCPNCGADMRGEQP